ncbi:MAG: VOC family protein [Mesorhizobium sp.]|nr:VOC family protein [bacterium M00.F.Ca.ET.205.01.1.1]TGU53127.1 VOC family protein [bacterium M00.F.Ca.ET.152.01.1.1]TGV36093.1 VOC family protein [Mesorhizobium sp. M00.F.Ca.ET.186.01.1.1]TGZ43680.1 VOC family protein [bacterium M00.F.Ca.ET.162.01.1.1]TJW31534.1 MAG: VOC family protein [Mesorhizobium sp.]
MATQAVDPARSIPILPSPDITATRDFYRDALGFGVVAPEMDDYLIVRRGEIEIHFWMSDDRKLPEVSSCYIRGGEVPALHAEFSARGVEKLSPFTVRPWNMKEFYIWDPHGNLLKFGCAPEEV